VNSIVKTPSNRILQSDDPSLLHQFFDRAAEQWPERIAVDVPPGIGRPHRRLVTYRELQQQSDRLAALLSTLVTGECVVAILLARRSEHLYSSQLAVLKAGAAYTCIDPAFPDEQVRDILKDAEAVALLTNNAGLVRAESLGFSGQVYDVAELTIPVGDAVVEPPIPSWLAPSSLAYIIYTSGTTGRPKGVMIEHDSISNLVSADLREFDLSTEDRVGQNSSPAYDSSVEEIWLAFAAGATVVVMDDDTTRMGPDLVSWLRSERITVFCPPPTLLRTTGCDDPLSALPDLSFLYVGGEALPDDVADRWARGRRLVNGYGPTECSVTAVRARIREGQLITIGRPVRGLQAWVLNEMLEEVDDGQRGELCIGGIGLARGYRNRPELTAKRFPVHPRLGRIYRTGDLVHRDPDGSFFYHGRIDSQVKLRGYRVELEAIEAKLAECEGVREAACRVQQNGSLQMLIAFVVPEDGHKPKFDDLKKSLLKALPAYMVPSRFAILDDLPTTVGGKLNRHALPLLETQDPQRDKRKVSPRSLLEERVEAAFCEVLRLNSGVDIHDDFFNDLGGDSLSAAELISLLRDDPTTASITVRDLYEARSVAELAKRAQIDEGADEMFEDDPAQSTGHPFLATSVQIIWLLIGLVLGSLAAYLAAFHALPFLLRGVGLIPFLLLSPLLVFMSLVVYTPAALLNAVIMKRLLIGRYRPLRAPVWGSFYVRNWMVQQAVRIIPWRLFQGTVFQIAALRALGARIGSRVHIHGGVNLLQGGWDLLEIGDDVTLSQDAAVRLVDLDDGHVIVGSVSLGDGSTLDVRAGVSGDTILEPEAFLTALSNLPGGGVIPRGERWDGIPAMPAGQSPPRPALPAGERIVSPFRHGIALVAARLGFWLITGLALVLPAIALALFHEVDANDFLSWLSSPSRSLSVLAAAFMMVTLPVPLTVVIQALAMRAMGRIPPGVISRWGYGYVRVCLKTRIVQSAGEWLSGTLFWPLWLRLAGMKIGRGCEISTIIDVVPELIEIGNESFFADGIYLSGPRVHRDTVTLAETRLGENTFLGNHVVVPAGQRLPDNVLIGICTVADDTVIRRDTAWFGHAPFELPRREVIEFDRRLTHDPSLIRYIDRVFWELLRSALLVVPLLILPVWFHFLEAAKGKVSGQLFFVAVVPLVSLATVAFLCLLVLVLKWGLLGRVRPGIHAFWSCWCSRWDFLYVVWAFYAYGPLSFLEGTLLLSWYLRAMGARIGRRVILGGGFAQVVDPDMLQFEDGATVSCQFQAHTFEDRVLKIDRVMIRRRATLGSGTVLLYGADIGARTQVAPHSVVMKRESLLPGHSYSGCPTRPVKSRHDYEQAQHSSERQAEYSTLG
jgi:non-ribosomal peptide synthetase-like protein